MNTTEATDLLAEFQDAADKAKKGINAEEARQAAREVDRIREQNRHIFGDEPIGVPIIREFRGPFPE